MAHEEWWADRRELMASFPPVLPHRLESMRGPGYSNWVIKNHLLYGQHPGCTTSEMVKNLTKLLDVGVTTFVCLQHEMPAANLAAKTFTTKGAPPSSRARSAFGDGVVVHAKPYIEDAQMLAEHSGVPQVSSSRPLGYLHLPIHDASGATVPDDVYGEFVLQVLGLLRAGELVYVQCGDGNGRSGELCAVLLGLVYGLSSSEALDMVQRCRNYRFGAQGLSPESHEQKLQVHRLLGNATFRDAAARTAPLPSTSTPAFAVSDTTATFDNVRQQLSRMGQLSLIRLRQHVRTVAAGRPLPPPAFARALRDFGLHLTDDELRVLFAASATEDGGAADGEALLHGIRGEMSDNRLRLVQAAFQTLPVNDFGEVDAAVVARTFSGVGHPDVKAGRRSESDVVTEFHATFKPAGKSKVVESDFVTYYGDLSATVPDDNYFQLMMWSAWPLKSRVPVDTAAGVALVGERVSIGMSGGYMAPKPAAPVAPPKLPPSATAMGVDNIRRIIKAAGEWGMPRFRLCVVNSDRDRDGFVLLSEIQEAVTTAKLIIPISSLEAFFRTLRPTRGMVRVVDVLEPFQEPLSPFRRRLVVTAFNHVDASNSGRVLLRDVISAFAADKHPYVVTSRRKTEDVYRDFVSTFSCVAGDGVVTIATFEQFYMDVSFGIAEDDEFQMVVWNCWGLGAKRSTTGRPRTTAELLVKDEEGLFGAMERLGSGKTPAIMRNGGQITGNVVTRVGSVPSPTKATLLATSTTSPFREVKDEEDESVAALRAKFVRHAFPASPDPASTAGGRSTAAAKPQDLHKRIRAACAARGATGVLALESRLIEASGGSVYIPNQAFVEALRGFAIVMEPREYTTLLQFHDPSGSGRVDARYFMDVVRGPMADSRVLLVRQAFNSMSDAGRPVPLDTLRMRYNAKMHPDVRSGKRTQVDVLREFLESCDIGHDGEVSLEEFLGYYSNISATIDDDNYFQMMIWNTWGLATRGPGTPGPASPGLAMPAGFSSTSRVDHHLTGSGLSTAPLRETFGLPPARSTPVKDVAIDDVLQRIRAALSRRGATSLAELGRSFRINDRTGRGYLSIDDFVRAMSRYGVKLSDQELGPVFQYFDRDHSDTIAFEEFMRGVRGALPPQRREVVQQAFNKLDGRRAGVVTVEDVALCFNPRENPDVRNGKKSERQVLKEFLDCFDGVEKDGQVTFEEFVEYYESVSAVIDDDSFFRLLIWNTWQLDKPNPRRG